MMLESCRCTVRGVVAQMRFVDANSPMRPVLKADPPAEPRFSCSSAPSMGCTTSARRRRSRQALR
jgi:hypothetical protein